MKAFLQSVFRITYITSQIVGKSFIRALKEEIRLSQDAARIRANIKKSECRTKEMSLQEAQLILNVNKLDKDEIEHKWKKLYEANQKSGSFYILSKVVRAKERLDKEMNYNNIQKCK